MRKLSCSKYWIIFIGLLLCVQSIIAKEDFRTWTSSDGRKLEAKFVKRSGNKIKIVNSSGKEFVLSLSRLSKEDQQYVLDAPLRESFKPPQSFSQGKKGALVIASLKGKVEVQDRYETKPASAGQVVTSQKSILTGTDGSAVIIFTNGTSASIGPNTQLFFQNIWQREFRASSSRVSQIKEETSPSRIAMELKMGELVVDVKKLKKDSSFLIDSPVAAVGIRGTKFGFSVSSSGSSVAVIEGEVVVLDSQKKAVKLINNQKFSGSQAGLKSVGEIPQKEARRINKSLGEIEKVSEEFSLSQLKDYMVNQEKFNNTSTAVTDWMKEYNRWVQNPSQYGGLETLEEIKDAYEKKSTSFTLYREMLDFTPLATLPNLRNLYCYYTDINDFRPLAKLTNITSLHLRKIDQSALNIISELKNLTNLSFSDSKITDLSPLTKLAGLSTLYLYDSNITDIRPLTRMEKLEDLSLSKVNQSDLEIISKLKSLTNLYLRDSKITDLTPLTKLAGLSTLYLYDSNITDIRPLTRMEKLEDLSLFEVNQSDLEIISKLKNLTELDLYESKITDLSPLTKLADLRRLYLEDSKITDIRPLTRMAKLEHLSLFEVNQSDLEIISELKNLTYFYLYESKITDIRPLTKLTKLKSLYLRNCKLTDEQKKELKEALPDTRISD